MFPTEEARGGLCVFGRADDKYITPLEQGVSYGPEFDALKQALETLRGSYSEANRQALRTAIEAANKIGIDIKKDDLYKEKLDILLSAVIQDHSYKSDGSQYYWDEEARAIFRNQRLEYAEKYRAGAKAAMNIGRNFFLPPIAARAGMTEEELAGKMGITEMTPILANDSYRQTAQRVFFIDAQMNGGIGSSIKRADWLRAKKVYENLKATHTQEEMQEILDSLSFLDMEEEIGEQEVSLSAKGSDMNRQMRRIGKSEDELMSITDIKLLSLYAKMRRGSYKGVSVVMLTSPTSEDIIRMMYSEPAKEGEKGKDNQHLINGDGEIIMDVFGDEGIAGSAMINQASYPSIRMDGDRLTLAFDREAPGGHGVWLKTLSEKLKTDRDVIVCISNSDAINSGTPVEVCGYMIENKKGVVVLVATREKIDRKGGIVGLKAVTLKDGRTIFVPSIMELAQAQGENKDLFTSMGFGEYEGMVPFNTNTVLINAGLFHAFLEELKGVLSEEEYASIMSPDLMDNGKSEENKETKVVDRWIQLEGALGSSVFNLNERLEVMRNEGNTAVDALLNKYFPNGMIGLVLANKEQRMMIFTPGKFAVDYWIYDNLGTVNPETYALEIDRAEAVNIDAPVKVGDASTVYADYYYFKRFWRDCTIDNLANLFINKDLKGEQQFGKVKMKDVDLRGNVRINNATTEDLLIIPELMEGLGFEKSESGKVILENVRIDAVERDGKIILVVSKLTDEEKIDTTSTKTFATTIDKLKTSKAKGVDGKEGAVFGRADDKYITPLEQGKQITPSSVAKEEAEKTVAMPSGMAAQKQAINMVFENLGETISIKFDTLAEARESGYTKVAAVPGIFVSEQSIQEMINKGMMKQNKDKYELLDAEGKVVAIVNDKNILTYKNGKPVTFKFNAMAKSEGSTTINFQFHLNEKPRAIFDCFDEQTKKDLLQAAKLLLNDRLLSDPVAEDRMLKVLMSDKLITKNINLSSIRDINEQLSENITVMREELSKNSGYTDPEVESLLRTSNINGVKSVQRQETYLKITPKTDIATRLNTMKNAGVTAIILRGDYNVDTIKFIKNHGFDVIIEFNEKDRAKLKSFVDAGLSGLRFVVKDAETAKTMGNLEQYYNDNMKMIEGLDFKTIPTISYEFDKSILSEEQLRNNAITLVKANDIELVVDVETCVDNLDTFKDLADSAKLVVKVDDNRNIDANSKMKEVLAKFYGVAICANKVFVTNMFRDNLKNNPRLVGRNIELNEMLKDISTIKDLLVEGNKTITEKDLEDLFTTEAIKQIKTLLEQNKDNLSLTTVVREYILGSMIATVEKEIISSDVQVGEKNYKILVGAALLMMINGASMDSINEMANNIEIIGDASISQLLNGEQSNYAKVAKEILGMWKSSDMKLISTDKQKAKGIDTVTLAGLIKLVLTMDTILPEKDLLGSSMELSLDGIKGILAAA